MFRLILFLALVIPFTSAGQNTISGNIRGVKNQRVLLQSIYGERTKTIDSTRADDSGTFQFTMMNRLPGMYRISWNKESNVDVIWNRENVEFTTTDQNPEDSITIRASEENRMFREFIRLDKMNQAKLQLLVQIIDYYPQKDSFYQTILREFDRIQNDQVRKLDSLKAVHPGAWAVRLARVYQGPVVPSSLGKEDRMAMLKAHYFDKVDFSDTALLRSMAFPNKAISYMSLYSNNRLSQKQLEAEFIKAVTVILGAASVNPDMFRYLLDYLVSGFDKFHFEEVITYIADNFSDPGSCEDQERKSALQRKLENFQKVAIGKIAPELSIPDAKNKIVSLKNINAEFTLLVFWSTTCPHCTAMMPRLNELYKGQSPKRFEVLAVSIDTSRTAWTTFLKEQKMNWINVSELKGYSGKATDDYNIYATPTIFLLDNEKKIIAKPITLMDLEQALRDHQLIR
jgi:peroxiredoxin